MIEFEIGQKVKVMNPLTGEIHDANVKHSPHAGFCHVLAVSIEGVGSYCLTDYPDATLKCAHLNDEAAWELLM